MSALSEWAAKRFWTNASTREVAQGWEITLDGRAVKTPAKAALAVPTRALAEAIAGEWAAQGERIEPQNMPFTRAANAAIDKVSVNREAVISMLAAYGETDLICYRAEAPQGLVARQALIWDRWLDWARDTHNAPLTTTAGIVPVAQPSQSLAQLRGRLEGMSDFQLAGAHDVIAISGSLVLALAALEGALDEAGLWEACRVDEEWQIAQWGRDEEADAEAQLRREALACALKFHIISGT